MENLMGCLGREFKGVCQGWAGWITVSGRWWWWCGIHPWTKLLSSGLVNREGQAKVSRGRGGPGSMCVWTHSQVFKATHLLKYTECLRGRTAEPESPWEKLTQRWSCLRQNKTEPWAWAGGGDTRYGGTNPKPLEGDKCLAWGDYVPNT